MCWKTRKTPVLKIAEENIHVKKILQKEREGSGLSYVFRSPCYLEQTWESGICYESPLGSPTAVYPSSSSLYPDYNIYAGFHSCRKLKVKYGMFITIEDNFEEKALWVRHYNESIFNAVIPKGAKYYLNESGEYVSDKLICYF